jgi:hypothetical protein
MKLVENYNGATLTCHYDRHIGVYLGFIEGLDVKTSVQATSYEDLVDAFHEAVDGYMEDHSALSGFQTIRDREMVLERVAEGETLKCFDDDDPFSRRQFLR